MNASYYIGWDVGGWNCDNNPNSRDAIVILDDFRHLVGTPWRGNLREMINQAYNSKQFVWGLFDLCGVLSIQPGRVTLAVDTPLGFSEDFVRLVSGQGHAGEMSGWAENPYLYRQTERMLFARQINPLSAVKDMIGSQATKGMHVLAKFAPNVTSIGEWSDGEFLKVIEAYPSPCKNSNLIKSWKTNWIPDKKDDINDAHTCALIAQIYDNSRGALWSPPEDIPLSEGWIWVPEDCLGSEIIYGSA